MKICRAGPQLMFTFNNRFFRNQACYSLLPARPGWKPVRVMGLDRYKVLGCDYLRARRWSCVWRRRAALRASVWANPFPVTKLSICSNHANRPKVRLHKLKKSRGKITRRDTSSAKLSLNFSKRGRISENFSLRMHGKTGIWTDFDNDMVL
jgi:hypothetical protein